jgi:NitT/TauT family transport system ATP-binding protein
MTALLRVEVARKGFADREVLAGIRFELARGEIVAITGPSGCGKSTLLRLVAGLDGDFAGAVTWRGAPPRLAMAFQEPRLLPWRSVRDNLLLADTPAASAEAMLAAMDLLTEADVTADRLSLGMARRVALLRALGSGPELLLLDEPFVSLDAAAAARARALLLRAWAEHGFAVLLVTHDQTEAAALADRILCLAGRPARLDREIMVPEMLRRPA